MESEYPLIPLGRLAKLRSGYAFKSADWTDSGCPVIKIANVKGGRIVADGCAYVSERTAKAAADWWTAEGDVLIAMTGYVGEVARVRRAEHFLVNQRVGRFEIAPASPVSAHYLFYVLQHPEVRGELENIARGSAQPNLSAKDAERIEIPVPGKECQKAIVEVLAALDDRIDLLRQTNTTLESIAQALFKSWFIGFDPVRAKQAGRKPEGMDAATAALFPAEFEESALGLIPKGWRVSEVGQAAECVGGGTPSTKEVAYWEPPVHSWATPKDLSGLGSPVLWATERRLSDAGLKKVSSGFLPSGTLLMSSRAPIGYLAISKIPLAVNQGFIAMRPGGLLPPVYLYFWCQASMDAIKQKANGSTFMEISKAAFRPIPLVLPPQEIVASFSEIAGALFECIAANEQQRTGLTDLRDTLLPRLISGKLRLPAARERLEDALA
jgi:type I restriction enzyme S subunit